MLLYYSAPSLLTNGFNISASNFIDFSLQTWLFEFGFLTSRFGRLSLLKREIPHITFFYFILFWLLRGFAEKYYRTKCYQLIKKIIRTKISKITAINNLQYLLGDQITAPHCLLCFESLGKFISLPSLFTQIKKRLESSETYIYSIMLWILYTEHVSNQWVWGKL